MLDRFLVINHRLRHNCRIVWRVVVIELSANVVIVVFVEVTGNRN